MPNQSETIRKDGAQRRPSQSAGQMTRDSITLDSIQRRLVTLTHSKSPRDQVLREFVELACRSTNAIWCGQFKKVDLQPLSVVAEHNGVADQNLALMKSSLLPSAENAIATARPQVVTSGELTVISTPIYGSNPLDTPQECLCLALSLGNESSASFVLILQMVATSISQWCERDQVRRLAWQIDSTAAIAELSALMSGADHQQDAAIIATNQLATFLQAELVAIGVVNHPDRLQTRVVSISGAMEVDSGGKLSRQIKSALEESLVRGEVTSYPDSDAADRSMKLAHRNFVDANPDSKLVTAPLVTRAGVTVGAWLCLISSSGNVDKQSRCVQFAKAVSQYLAESLDVAERASEGPVARVRRQFGKFAAGRVGKVVAGLALAAAVILAAPIPHRIACSSVLKPAQRQFVVAPHHGILHESFVKPGDVVAEGQLLARMDDAELRLELAELTAEQQSAVKERDVSRSSGDAAATTIASLKVQQLAARIQLVQHRLSHLEMKAVARGVVLQGDLEDAQGAPVRTGDVLMEIAALDQLKLEVEIPESHVSYVEPGQSVRVVLDGNPFDSIEGTINRVRPESEAREQQNVFVGEVLIDNSNQVLRPGMKGQARISESWRPIGWILFHRPCEKLFSLLR
jgi:biotin carboxyl carrier protein